MSPTDPDYLLVWLVRRLFRAFAAKAEETLDDAGISVAERAVIEFLYPDKELSVPEIASRYQVSRQHVQITVNGLLEKKLVTTRVNPRHKRSSLLLLSANGRSLFSLVRQREKKVLAGLLKEIPRNHLVITCTTLQKIFDNLEEGKNVHRQAD